MSRLRENLSFVLHRVRSRLPGSRSQRLFALWLVVFCYLGMQVVLPIGPWYHHYQYQLGIERSWATLLATIWLAVLLVFVLRRWAPKVRLAITFSLLLLAVFLWRSLNPELSLRRALRKTEKIIIHMKILAPDQNGNRGWTDVAFASIRDPQLLREIADSLRFVDPPWGILHYLCLQGDFELHLFAANGKLLTSFEIVNKASGVLWRKWMNTDRQTNKQFQNTLRKASFASLPQDNGLALPDLESCCLTIFIAHWITPESVERLAEKMQHVNAAHRAVIARLLGSPDMPVQAAEPLLRLAKDSDPEVRQAAFYSLGDFRKVPKVEIFLQSYNLESEPDVEVRKAIEYSRRMIIH